MFRVCVIPCSIPFYGAAERSDGNGIDEGNEKVLLLAFSSVAVGAKVGKKGPTFSVRILGREIVRQEGERSPLKVS